MIVKLFPSGGRVRLHQRLRNYGVNFAVGRSVLQDILYVGVPKRKLFPPNALAKVRSADTRNERRRHMTPTGMGGINTQNGIANQQGVGSRRRAVLVVIRRFRVPSTNYCNPVPKPVAYSPSRYCDRYSPVPSDGSYVQPITRRPQVTSWSEFVSPSLRLIEDVDPDPPLPK